MILPTILFEICLVALMIIGLFIAAKLDDTYPRWVRYMCLAPCLAAAFTLHSIILGVYVAYFPDLLILASTVAVYFLLASRFTSRPMLDLRNKTKENDEA
jgi:hypothetical protein